MPNAPTVKKKKKIKKSGKYIPGTRRNKKRPDVCDICRLTMTHKDELIYHLKKIHKTEYRCKQCNKCYKSSKNLSNHEKIHSAAKQFVCDVCGYASYNRGTVETHRKRHAKAYTDICDICNKGFYTRYQLEEHYNLHTGNRPFVCEYCEKGFICKGTLEKHKIASHSTMLENVKNFPCTVCEKTFLFKKYLVRHMRSHSGEKPFVCTFCGKGLASSYSLTIHKRTHTGEKPFVCHVCGKGFSHVNYLKDHEKSHSVPANTVPPAPQTEHFQSTSCVHNPTEPLGSSRVLNSSEELRDVLPSRVHPSSQTEECEPVPNRLETTQPPFGDLPPLFQSHVDEWRTHQGMEDWIRRPMQQGIFWQRSN